MKKTLIVATTSYAGMGPYVSEIVNTFTPEDNIYYFFHDYEDHFFKKNIKESLHSKSFFYVEANTPFNKLYNIIFNKYSYDASIIKICKLLGIEQVHYINGVPSCKMQHFFKKLGIKVWSTVHDLMSHESKKIFYKQWRHKIYARRQIANLCMAENIITNSKEQFEGLKSKYSRAAIEFHPFPSLVTNTIIKGKNIPNELRNIEKYILFFGRIEEYKGLHLLYDAFSTDDDLKENYKLVIAGRGTLNFNLNCNEKNVLWINRYIDDSEIAMLYSKASCVIYPYISATQSGVLSLAFYYEIPTVVSDVPFFKNIVEESKGGIIFKSGDIEDLKKKIKEILNVDKKLYAANQRKYYKSNYDSHALRNRLLQIYQ